MKVLFLVTRLPVPPWRGDQVRAYHHLRQLAPRHDITCCALVTRPPPDGLRAVVEALGVRLEVVPLGTLGALPALARALLGDSRPLQVLLYLRQGACRRVAELLRAGRFDVVHAQLVRTAPYLPEDDRSPVVLDLIDALSANLAGRARRERDALCGGERIAVVANGVDTEAFAFRDGPRPAARVVFAGNLGYFPNVDAARWLVADIFPWIRATLPEAEVHQVGARPARAVRALVRTPGVTLAAAVPDMAPELAAATVALVPMRAGTGLQNKVLEAMAVGTPVVATPSVAAALDVTPGTHLMVAGDAAELAAATVALLRDPARARAMATAARGLVERRYRWDDSAAGVEAAWEASRVAAPASPCARQGV